jgi:uncharacterized protein (TIGR02145 family)
MKWNRILGCLAAGAMFWGCSDTGSDDNGVAGGASGDAGIVAVTDWEVAGVSQKGPFVTGSAVTVQELDGITLKQTGKSFKGTIKSDKGDFAIKDINLESQYAILEASGYYRDEISGKKSSSQVTLRALTDLKDRKHVNINLLTHLEYERVMYLVTEKKKSIAEAKEQAEKEVLATFGIEGDFAESEDLNIFETGDGNAALLAISVLLQSDVDVAGLTERMGEFSISLAEGGSWDDADAKTAIADWACDVDLKGSLSKVRKNVEDWKYADTVPAFEKYVSNFWWDNYGLGVCNTKRENETKRNVNKLSKLYNEYFVCENGRWVIPGYEPRSSSSSNQDPSGISFGVMKDSRDGQEYKTVRIGNQVWMAENLNYAAEGSRCYGDDKKNCEKYGRLYNWDIALDTTSEGCGKNFNECTLKSDFYPRQGVCPDGWHLPDLGEWDDLIEYTDDDSDEETFGFSLQSYYWDDDWEKQYGTDEFGFNAMPAGMFDGGKYVGLDSVAIFWTSSKIVDVIMNGSITTLNYVMLEKKSSGITRSRGGDVDWGLSVRCVKGTGNKRPESSSSIASSSSVTNPFISSSSPVKHDTIPKLTGDLAFLESFFDEYKSYVTFENDKQKNWVVSTMKYDSLRVRDSALVAFGDTLIAQGFGYAGRTLIDDALCLQEGDSAYAYVKNVGGLVYKIYVKRKTQFYTTLLGAYYGYDLKIVALENGMEERLSVNCKSLKYEKELPEEVRFIGDFGNYSNKQGWNDDSLMTFWFVDGYTPDSWRDTSTCRAEGRSEIETRLDSIKSALVEKGFTLVKDDVVEVSSRYYSHSSILVQDGRIQVSFYEMETEKALYKLEVYSGVSEGGDVFARHYRYMFFVDIRTYYKNRPE